MGNIATKPGRVLLVDDDGGVLRAYTRTLSGAGFSVEAAAGGDEALAQLRKHDFDAVVSDISMPGLNGLLFLRAIRERNLDVPVILMTGGPAIETAIEAVEFGAFRYLLKPIDNEVLIETVRRAVRIHSLAKLKKRAFEITRGGNTLGDDVDLEPLFANALDKLWMAFQPVVSMKEKRVYGWEALLRTDEPKLARPPDFLEAAERLGRLDELGRAIRARAAGAIPFAPDGSLLLVNLHPRDLMDEELVSPAAPLSLVAARVVLEITERDSLDDVTDLRGRLEALRKLGFRIAVDDLGAGYSGLSSFTQLDPDVVKLDMSLVRGIADEPVKRSVVRSMVELCGELEMTVIAEGVETAGERDALSAIGADLLQGYLFAKPARTLAPPVF